MAIATKVKIEEAAPAHPTAAPVSNLHKTVQVTPSGWVKARLDKAFGTMNMAYTISPTAKLTSR